MVSSQMISSNRRPVGATANIKTTQVKCSIFLNVPVYIDNLVIASEPSECVGAAAL
jgi:hypothetical protein